MKTVAIIGAGSFGTALSTIVAAKGCKVRFFDTDKAHLDRMKENMENVDYLPGVKLEGDYEFLDDNKAAVTGADVILFAVPAQVFRVAASAIVPYIKEDALMMNIAKGIEQKSLKCMSQVAEEIGIDMNRYACISGPSHAEEVGIGVPTAVSISSRSEATANALADLFATNRFRIYLNDDLLGMELAGSIKNVMAVGSGIIDGLGYGDNTRAAMITRAIAEMTRLGVKMGAQPETFAGLSGVGDMIVTCTSMHSRNFRCGRLIGEGKDPEEARKEIGMVVEGMFTAESAHDLAAKYEVEMPIAESIYNVIKGNVDVNDALEDLMGRPRKSEDE